MAKGFLLSLLLALSSPLLARAEADPKGGWDPDYSIGLHPPISSDGHSIHDFHVVGAPLYPEIMSDRVVLTPPSPGGQRTGLWSEHTNAYNEWTADLEFRAGGPERGKGSISLWYTAAGRHRSTGYDSIYTSKPFDGLALVVDNTASGVGQLRGYLNDGTKDYSIHHDVQSLAFGHCDVWYRNRGATTSVKVIHTFTSLRVEVDGNFCFETTAVRLPLGYYFGITAASAEIPDNIELFQFKLWSPERAHHPEIKHFYHDDENKNDQHHPPAHDFEAQQRALAEEKEKARRSYAHRASDNYGSNSGDHGQAPHERDLHKWHFEDDKDTDAKMYKTQEEQFQDLHNRLQAMTHHLSSIQAQIGSVYDHVDSVIHRQDDFHSEARGTRVPREQTDRLEAKINEIAEKVNHLEQAFYSKDYTKQFEAIHHVLRDQHHSLLYATSDTVQKAVAGKKHRGLYFLMFLNVLLVGSYLVYKRRKATMPKKYL